MGLLYFIEEDHAIGLPADSLGQLAAFLIAHVSGRRSDEPGDGELLHILGHIDPHQVVLIIKQSLGQSLGKLCLAYACGAQEQEGANGTVGVLNTGTAALDGLGNGADSLILADHTLVEDRLQIQQLLPLPLNQAADGNAGPPLHDLSDFLVGDLVPKESAVRTLLDAALLLLQLFLSLRQFAVFQLGSLAQVIALLGSLDLSVQLLNLLPELLGFPNGVLLVVPLGLLGLEVVLGFRQLLLDLSQTALAELVFFLLQGFFLDLQLDDLPVDGVQLCGHGVHLGPQLGAGLIDQVDGLVRQKPVGDIPVGQGGGGNDGGICDLHAVEDLIPFLQATENSDGVLHRRLVDHHRLEPAFQGRVLLNVLAVLVQSGCADAVQFTPGQHGL